MPTTRTRRACAQKQKNYRITDDDDDSDENVSSVDENEIAPSTSTKKMKKATKTKTTKKKNDYGGILAVLDDNSQKKGNSNSNTTKRQTTTTTTNNQSKTAKKDSVPTKTSATTKKPRTNKKNTVQSSSSTAVGNGELTPKRDTFQDKTKPIVDEAISMVGVMTTPPPTAVFIAKTDHHSCMSPSTPLGFGSPMPVRHGLDGTDGGGKSLATEMNEAHHPGDDVSAMSCSVASVLSKPLPKGSTTTTTTTTQQQNQSLKIYEKRLCAGTADSPAWEYRAEGAEVLDEDDDDDERTIPVNEQPSYIAGEEDEEDDSYQEGVTHKDVDETALGGSDSEEEGEGDDSDDEEEDGDDDVDNEEQVDEDEEEELFSEPESDDELSPSDASSDEDYGEDDESEEYIPDDDDSVSDGEDSLEFDDIESPVPAKTRKGKANKVKNNDKVPKKARGEGKKMESESPEKTPTLDEPQDDDMIMGEDEVEVEAPIIPGDSHGVVEKPIPVESREKGQANKKGKIDQAPKKGRGKAKKTKMESPEQTVAPDEPQDDDMYMGEDEVEVEASMVDENNSDIGNANGASFELKAPVSVQEPAKNSDQQKAPRPRASKPARKNESEEDGHKEAHSPIVQTKKQRMGTAKRETENDDDTDIEASPMVRVMTTKQVRQKLASPEPLVAVVLDDDDGEDDDVVAKVLDVSAYISEDEESCEAVEEVCSSNIMSHSLQYSPQKAGKMEKNKGHTDNDAVDESFMTMDEAESHSVVYEVEDNEVGMPSKQSETESSSTNDEKNNNALEPEVSTQSEDEREEEEDEVGTTLKQPEKVGRSPGQESGCIAESTPKGEVKHKKEDLYTPTKTSNRSFKKYHRHEGIVKRGKWNLGAKIGVGSFGVVHVGMNTETGTLMAVKTFKMEGAVMKDIRREIELMRSLDHINIVRYFGAQADKSHLHIFQEWVPAGSVATLLGKFGPFAMTVARRYLSQILSGLAYLHENNIMHRDIKGSNILVNDEGVVKLADFGASKKLANLQDDLLMSLTVRGTPYFMAPEVFEEKYSAKADIWGAGCVAVQMVTGSPPWKEMGFTNPISLFNHIKRHDGPPAMDIPDNDENMSESEKQVLNLFERFLRKCFHQDPSMRPTARILLQDSFFLELHHSSEDEQTPCRGFFSPGSDTASFWSPVGMPSSAATPSPQRLHRSKSVVQWKATFMSPPLPKRNPDRGSPSPLRPNPSPLRPSPSRRHRHSPAAHDPDVDTSEWPKWALDRRKSLLEKENATLHQAAPPERLSNLMGSLAISEDSELSGRNGLNPFRSSGSTNQSNLNGLKFLDGSSVLERSSLTYEL